MMTPNLRLLLISALLLAPWITFAQEAFEATIKNSEACKKASKNHSVPMDEGIDVFINTKEQSLAINKRPTLGRLETADVTIDVGGLFFKYASVELGVRSVDNRHFVIPCSKTFDGSNQFCDSMVDMALKTLESITSTDRPNTLECARNLLNSYKELF